jgi:hypothetical protein
MKGVKGFGKCTIMEALRNESLAIAYHTLTPCHIDWRF